MISTLFPVLHQESVEVPADGKLANVITIFKKGR